MPLRQIFWLLDYDGSLCPHREEWEFGGHYDPQALGQLLDELAKSSAGLMWNTGRSVESLKMQSAHFLKHSGFFEHGATFWDGASSHDLIGAPLIAGVADRLVDWARSRQNWLRLEFKPHSVRLIPVRACDRSRLLGEFHESGLGCELANSREVYLSEGWRALEVVKADVNKSHAIDQLNARGALADSVALAAVGDDVGDFETISRVLAQGGFAYLVGSHCGWIVKIPHRASQVAFFASPQELLNHLTSVAAAGLLEGDAAKTKIPHALSRMRDSNF